MKKRYKFSLTLFIFLGCLFLLFQSMNVETKSKVDWSNKNLNSALAVIGTYYYYYNNKDFNSINSKLLYYPIDSDKKKLAEKRRLAFFDYRSKYGNYISHKYQYPFQYLKICNKDYRFLAKYFADKKLKQQYASDKHNLLNSYCGNTSKNPPQLQVNYTAVYQKGTDTESGFVLVYDEGKMKILKFPHKLEAFEENTKIATTGLFR